ncbi:MAG: hypothetical protein ACLRSW_07855 [Christensenellaceae bacterium]
MKRPGLTSCLPRLYATLVCAAAIAAEILLFTKYMGNMVPKDNGWEWTNMWGAAGYVLNFYYISDYIISIVQLIYQVLLFILLMGLYKKYYARGYMLLSCVALFVPLSRYIAVFVIRNNKAIDYDAYMRARREEFMRRQQQQNSYGYGRPPYQGGPYDRGPYGGAPYNQPPYDSRPPRAPRLRRKTPSRNLRPAIRRGTGIGTVQPPRRKGSAAESGRRLRRDDLFN